MSSVRKNRCGNAMESIQALYKCLRDEVAQIEKVYLTCEKTERDTIVELIKGMRIRDDLVIVEDKIKEIRKGGKE